MIGSRPCRLPVVSFTPVVKDGLTFVAQIQLLFSTWQYEGLEFLIGLISLHFSNLRNSRNFLSRLPNLNLINIDAPYRVNFSNRRLPITYSRFRSEEAGIIRITTLKCSGERRIEGSSSWSMPSVSFSQLCPIATGT